MATIAFAWELGGGFGHLRPHAGTLRTLHEQGHAVHVISRELHRVMPALGDIPAVCWQAPYANARPDPHYRPTRNFAHILHNCGYGSAEATVVRVSAWRNLLAAIGPDLAIVDYAPAALLALRGTGIPAIAVGTGFCLPPDAFPLPTFATVSPELDAGDRCEERILDSMNAALSRFRSPPLDRLSQLFAEVDEAVLQTYPELDHYGPRRGIRYVGVSQETGGRAPEWPRGDGPTLFAYLKPFPQIESVLETLAKRRLRTLIAADGIPADVIAKYRSETLRIVPPKLNFAQAAAECTAAITNAGHSGVCRLLLAGKPGLHVPLQLEQELTAYRVARSGLGLSLPPTRVERFSDAIDRLLDEPELHSRTARFAARYCRPEASDPLLSCVQSRLPGRVGTEIAVSAPKTGVW